MFSYFINNWKKDYHILTMKIREVWTDRGLQNRVAETALFLPLYSPTSWAVSRVHRLPQDSPIFEFGAWWRHKSLAPDSSEESLEFLTSGPWTKPRVPLLLQLAPRKDTHPQGGTRSVTTTFLHFVQFICHLYRRSLPYQWGSASYWS